MKKTLIAISIACVGALAATAEVASYADLRFVTNTWFTVSCEAGEVVPSGGLIDGTLVPGEFMAFDTTSTGAPVVFTANEGRTSDVTTVTFDVKAATVPNGALATVGEKKNAVCLYESALDPAATNFYVNVGGGWVQMTSAKTPFEGDEYRLVARFDGRADVRKVQFSAIIGGEEVLLTKDGAPDGWLAFESVAERVNVGFLGKGSVKSLSGDQLVIIAEAIIIEGGGAVTVKESDIPAFEKAVIPGGEYDSVEKVLAAKANDVYPAAGFRAASDLTVAEAYALGLLRAGDGGVMAPVNAGVLAIKADAATVDAATGNVGVGFVDAVPNADSEATFTYQLQEYDGSAWAPVGTAVSSLSEITIPGTSIANGRHYFKVVTTVTLKGAK